MPHTFHSKAYRKLEAMFNRLKFGTSLASRIYLSTSLILLATGLSYALIYSFQLRQAAIAEGILTHRLQSLEAARRLKEAVVSYDNATFRFVATKSSSELQEAEEVREAALLNLNQLFILTKNSVIQSRLIELRRRLKAYFKESAELIEFAKQNKLPPKAGLFEAATWARNQINVREEITSLSEAGSDRMGKVLSLCNEVVSYTNSMLEMDNKELLRMRTQSRYLTLIVLYASIGFVILISMALAIMIVGPLRILKTGVQQIEAGEFKIELPVTSATELGELTMAFNRMAKKIYSQQERLLKETVTDNLTGAYNQRYFTRRLVEEFDRSKRAGEPLSLVMVDVDHFKSYNDTLGHEMGNVVLKKIADIIRENLRSVDMLFRYGGDEFALILPNADSVEGHQVCVRLIETMNKVSLPGSGPNYKVRLTFSIGGASFPLNASSLDDLKAKADEMLYLAKNGGRNCYRWYQELNITGSTSI